MQKIDFGKKESITEKQGGDTMQIMITASVFTIVMFAIVFMINIAKEEVVPIIINLVFLIMMIYMWFIVRDVNIIEYESGVIQREFYNVIHIFMMAITSVQFLINVMLICLKAIEKREKRKKEVQ